MKTARKLLSLLLVLVMCLCMLTACGDNSSTTASDNDDNETTTSTKDKGNGGNGGSGGPIGGLLDDLTNTDVDPSQAPYDAIVSAWALAVQDAGVSYLSMLDSIPSIVDGTATYEMAMDMYDSKVDLSAVVDPKNLKASADVKLDIQGVSTEASLWLGDDIAVSVPDLLGDKAYGVKLSKLLEDLDKSWILSLAGVSSADELVNSVLSESGISASDLEELETMLGELADLEKELTDTLTETVNTFAEDLAAYLEGLETAVTEKDGKTVITTTVVSDDFADLMILLADTIDSMLDSFMSGTMGDLLADQDLNMDELRDEAESMRGEAGELLIVHTLTAEGKLAKFEFFFVDETGETQDETIAIVFDTGDAFGFEVIVEEYTALTFKALGGNSEGFEITIPDEEAAIRFERNKQSGDFSVDMQSYGETVTAVKGNLQYGSDKFAIELDSITADGETMDIGFKVAIKAGGKVKSVPNYQNLLTMSESQVQSLLSSVQNSSLFQDLM